MAEPKVLFIAETVDEKSGAGRYAARLIEALKKKGAKVEVVELRFFGARGIMRFIRLVIVFLKARRAVSSVDLVHAADGWPHGVFGALLIFGTSKRLVITGVGTYSVLPLAGRIRGPILRFAYRHADMVVCISRYTEAQLRARVPGIATRVVHLGTTALPTPTNLEVEEHRRRYGLQNRTPIFLTVGEVKERKGQLDTLRGLALLKEEYPSMLYVVIGSTEVLPYVDGLKTYSKVNGLLDNTLILSAVNDHELACWYAVSDIFFLNSNNDHGHFEGFGLVILEAGHFGVPAIGSLGCGIEDAIQEGKSGFLVPQKDHVALAAAARQLLQDSISFRKISQGWASGFTWEKSAEEHLLVYQALIQQTKQA